MEVYVLEDDSEARRRKRFRSSKKIRIPEEAEPAPELTREQFRRLAEGFAREPAVDDPTSTCFGSWRGTPTSRSTARLRQ